MVSGCRTLTVAAGFDPSEVRVSSCRLLQQSVAVGERFDMEVVVQNGNNTTASARLLILEEGINTLLQTDVAVPPGSRTFAVRPMSPDSPADYGIESRVASPIVAVAPEAAPDLEQTMPARAGPGWGDQ